MVGMVFLQRNSALALIQNHVGEGAGGMRFPSMESDSNRNDLSSYKPVGGYRAESRAC